jgi:hypothetical protein
MAGLREPSPRMDPRRGGRAPHSKNSGRPPAPFRRPWRSPEAGGRRRQQWPLSTVCRANPPKCGSHRHRNAHVLTSQAHRLRRDRALPGCYRMWRAMRGDGLLHCALLALLGLTTACTTNTVVDDVAPSTDGGDATVSEGGDSQTTGPDADSAPADPTCPACVAVDAGGAPDAPNDGPTDSAVPPDAGIDAGSSPCTHASDCRTFSNYCGGCTCDALGASEPNPVCDAGTVSCLLDPCNGRTAVCDPTGRCALQ